MKIKVHGAAGGEVTGSAYLVQTAKSRVLIDAGMFQGGRESEAKNKIPQGITPDKIDAILLTHGHLDHTGRVPLLIKYGFDGPIYSTEETIELAQIILQDSARLQVADAMRQNKRAWRKRKAQIAEPLYNTEHVELMMELTHPITLDKPVRGKQGVEIARESIPDLIVCDVLMPEMDGHEVLSHLLETAKTHQIPFIFSTYMSERVDRTEALKLGADDYIIKPFEPESLLKIAKFWIASGSHKKPITCFWY